MCSVLLLISITLQKSPRSLFGGLIHIEKDTVQPDIALVLSLLKKKIFIDLTEREREVTK